MDGWEDDDDLEIDSVAGENEQQQQQQQQQQQNDLVPSSHTDNGGGEWSFDDDVILDEEETDQTSAAPLNDGVASQTQQEQESSAAANALAALNNNDAEQAVDGGDWSFDDDEILSNEEEPAATIPSTAVPLLDRLATVEPKQPAEPKPPPPATHFLDRLANDEKRTAHQASPVVPVAQAKPSITKELPSSSQPAADEWSFDDDSFLEEPQDSAPSSEANNDITNIKQEQMYQNLVRYMETLPALLPSLNALLEAEYNTYHHAVELTEYYASRPQLYDYTLDTELPRMDYQVILPNKQRITDKYQVQQYLLSQDKETNLLIRSANQSLMADLLAQLSGPDRFIQHQYLATAVATQCHFSLHPALVECQCHLNLSLPSATGDRLDVARLEISIHFGQPPSVTYRLHKVERLLEDYKCLRETAAFLASLEEDSFLEEEVPTSDDLIRDAFMEKLSQTQQFVEDSHAGLTSAWKQIDSVANVSSKLGFLKKNLTTLPSNKVMETAAAATVAPSPHAQNAAAPPPPVPHHGGVAPPTAVKPPPPNGPPPNGPPPSNINRGPPPLPPPGGAQDRPAPILGGLLRSGWSRLAQSVTLPDEELVHPAAEASPIIPKLYRPENPTPEKAPKPPPLQSASRDAPQQQTTLPSAPPPKVPDIAGGGETHDAMAESPPPEDDMQDGWGDDDLDLEDDVADDEDLVVETSKPPPPPPPQRPPQPTATIAPPPPRPPTQAPTRPAQAPPPAFSLTEPSPPLTLTEYNPEDDIVPTRKRWVNPRPGSRQLRV